MGLSFAKEMGRGGSGSANKKGGRAAAL